MESLKGFVFYWKGWAYLVKTHNNLRKQTERLKRIIFNVDNSTYDLTGKGGSQSSTLVQV